MYPKMVRVTRQIELDYGHTLPNHYSFCNQLHGHRARVVATVFGSVCLGSGISSEGMVYDFKLFKELMMDKVHAVLDHGFAVWEDDKQDLEFVCSRNKKVLITKQPPTAEYLAEWAFNQIRDGLPPNLALESVQWHETPNSWAEYRPQETVTMD